MFGSSKKLISLLSEYANTNGMPLSDNGAHVFDALAKTLDPSKWSNQRLSSCTKRNKQVKPIHDERIFEHLYNYTMTLLPESEQQEVKDKERALLNSPHVGRCIFQTHSKDNRYYTRFNDASIVMKYMVDAMTKQQFESFINERISHTIDPKQLRDLPIVSLIIFLEVSKLENSDKAFKLVNSALKNNEDIYIKYQNVIDKLNNTEENRGALEHCRLI